MTFAQDIKDKARLREFLWVWWLEFTLMTPVCKWLTMFLYEFFYQSLAGHRWVIFGSQIPPSTQRRWMEKPPPSGHCTLLAAAANQKKFSSIPVQQETSWRSTSDEQEWLTHGLKFGWSFLNRSNFNSAIASFTVKSMNKWVRSVIHFFICANIPGQAFRAFPSSQTDILMTLWHYDTTGVHGLCLTGKAL